MNKINRKEIEWMKISSSGGASDLDYYQNTATKSAVYPGQGTPFGLAYVALKLNGEAGELAEHVGKAMRDDSWVSPLFEDEGQAFPSQVVRASGPVEVFSSASYPLTTERRNLIIKEIGDILWYLSAACNELGISFSEAAITNLEKLADRQERNVLRGSGDER